MANIISNDREAFFKKVEADMKAKIEEIYEENKKLGIPKVLYDEVELNTIEEKSKEIK